MPIEDILLFGAILVGIPAFVLLRQARAVRRSRRELRRRVQDAIEKITADGIVEGPKGTYKPRRWGRKWVAYANSIPAPRGHYEMQGRELPTLDREKGRFRG